MRKTHNAEAAPARRLRRTEWVLDLVPVHRHTLQRWERAGTFPRRVVLGPGVSGYYEDEVLRWIESREPGTTIRSHKSEAA